MLFVLFVAVYDESGDAENDDADAEVVLNDDNECEWWIWW